MTEIIEVAILFLLVIVATLAIHAAGLYYRVVWYPTTSLVEGCSLLHATLGVAAAKKHRNDYFKDVENEQFELHYPSCSGLELLRARARI
nr:hypothetical protein [Tanacetum cinerariifolium]